MKQAALYIHIPFCHQKCHYCDFYSEVTSAEMHAQFVDALSREIAMYGDHSFWQQQEFSTIYFGGGTPSVLTIAECTTIMQSLHDAFSFTDRPEITIEINPESAAIEKLAAYREIGINRLSIGVQSLNDTELGSLGRIHDAKKARKVVADAQRAGFDNISVDLIFAIPGQSLNDWKQNVQAVVGMNAQHVSMYGLTYETGTKFDHWRNSGKLTPATDSLERSMYLAGIELLAEHGIQQYEISNLAIPRFESQHNQKYWDGSPYLGLGPSAHSFWNRLRQWNISSIRRYQVMLADGHLPVADSEQIDAVQRKTEYVMLHLRTVNGIDLNDYQQQFGISFLQEHKHVLEKLKLHSPVVFNADKNSFRLSREGCLLYDEICAGFV